MGKKQTSRNQLDDDFEIEGNQTYARALGPRGNHQHEVEFIDGSKKLVTLPPKYRNVVWLKRGKVFAHSKYRILNNMYRSLCDCGS